MNEGRSHRVTILYPVPFENFSSFFHELFRSRPRSGKVFSFEQINPKWDNLSPPQPLSLAQPPKREFFNNNGTKKLVTRRWRVGATFPFLSLSNEKYLPRIVERAAEWKRNFYAEIFHRVSTTWCLRSNVKFRTNTWRFRNEFSRLFCSQFYLERYQSFRRDNDSLLSI